MNIFSCLSSDSVAPSLVNFPFSSQELDELAVHKAHILLVEDNPVLQYLHRQFLEQAGYHVTLAASGEEALERFDAHFDAILMDIDLPGMDGITTTQALRNTHPHLNIPVIACTTHSESEMKAACLSAGMIDYLQKPVSVTGLSHCLHLHLAKKEVCHA